MESEWKLLCRPITSYLRNLLRHYRNHSPKPLDSNLLALASAP